MKKRNMRRHGVTSLPCLAIYEVGNSTQCLCTPKTKTQLEPPNNPRLAMRSRLMQSSNIRALFHSISDVQEVPVDPLHRRPRHLQ
jgi:hypothetical protein